MEKFEKFKSLTIATDFSEASDFALIEGAAWADCFDWTPKLIHLDQVMRSMKNVTGYLNEPPSELTDFEKVIEENIKSSHKLQLSRVGLTEKLHDFRILNGNPRETINEFNKESGSGLLVLGATGHTKMEKLFIGSLADMMLKHSEIPVLLAKSGSAPAPKRIIFATDFSQASEEALIWTAYLGKKFNATVKVVHLLEPYWEMLEVGVPESLYHSVDSEEAENKKIVNADEAADEARERLNAVVQQIGLENVESEVLISKNLNIAENISNAASSYEADLTVMGTHGRKAVARFFLGSVALSVAERSENSVLLVR